MVPTADKIRLINALSSTGIRRIEAVSFVSQRALPQMADAGAVLTGIERNPEVFYSALVPNRKGAEAAVDANADGMQVFIAATDSYNLKNVRKTVAESLHDVAEVAELGRDSGVPVEATISTSFGDPDEGDVAPQRVLELSRWMLDHGLGAISYGDTTGMATPRRVAELVEALSGHGLPGLDINMHFHDTRGTGLANAVTALQLGVDYFDAAVGGMGGSPFASEASGNIATEDLVHMLDDMGVATGVDLGALIAAADIAQGFVEGELPGKVLRAGPRAGGRGRPGVER